MWIWARVKELTLTTWIIISIFMQQHIDAGRICPQCDYDATNSFYSCALGKSILLIIILLIRKTWQRVAPTTPFPQVSVPTHSTINTVSLAVFFTIRTLLDLNLMMCWLDGRDGLQSSPRRSKISYLGPRSVPSQTTPRRSLYTLLWEAANGAAVTEQNSDI